MAKAGADLGPDAGQALAVLATGAYVPVEAAKDGGVERLDPAGVEAPEAMGGERLERVVASDEQLAVGLGGALRADSLLGDPQLLGQVLGLAAA